jgi:hypothetical protein
MNRGIVSFLIAAALAAGLVALGTSEAKDPCAKYSGYVLMTYSNPDTIIFKVIRGKVSAATPFTMTPTTVYIRNGRPSAFGEIRAGDTGYISAIEQLPSGVLLACTVVVSGP